MNKKIIYIDMDGVLVDFDSAKEQLDNNTLTKYKGELDNVPNIFSKMKPMPQAIASIHQLAEYYDLYILSTAPWNNSTAWSDKIEWIHRYFGQGKDCLFYKRVILSHNKDLNIGDYLIDDRTKNGASQFKGKHIHFGSEEFPDWTSIVDYLIKRTY